MDSENWENLGTEPKNYFQVPDRYLEKIFKCIFCQEISSVEDEMIWKELLLLKQVKGSGGSNQRTIEGFLGGPENPETGKLGVKKFISLGQQLTVSHLSDLNLGQIQFFVGEEYAKSKEEP